MAARKALSPNTEQWILLSGSPPNLATISCGLNLYASAMFNPLTASERIEVEAIQEIKKAEYTEKLIMFANSYRSQFAEVARNCAKAELYFFDAKFDEAIEMVKESLKRYIDISVFEYKNQDLEGVNLWFI